MGIALAAVLFFRTAPGVYAYTIGTLSTTWSEQIADVTVNGMRFQGVFGSSSYEQNGKYYNTAMVEFDQRLTFANTTSANSYLTGRFYYVNSITATLSDTAGRIVNAQINIIPVDDSIIISNSHKSGTSSAGTYTREVNMYTTFNNTYSETRTYYLAHIQCVITWESTVTNSYCQIQIEASDSATASTFTKSQTPLSDEIAMQTIIDALADSDDIQGIVDYLQNIDTNAEAILTYITSNYPTMLSRMLSLITLQQANNQKLGQLYDLVEDWYYYYMDLQLEAESAGIEASSEAAEASSVAEDIDTQMTYETVSPNNAVDNADDIITLITQDTGRTAYLWEWLTNPLVGMLIAMSSTIAIVSFIIYGKK